MNSEPTPRTDAARESYIHPILMQIRWAVDIELARTIELELIASNKRVVELNEWKRRTELNIEVANQEREKDKKRLKELIGALESAPLFDMPHAAHCDGLQCTCYHGRFHTAMHNQKESEG